MEHSDPKALTSMMWALATMGVRPSLPLIRTHEKQTAARIGGFTGTQVCIIMWAYASVGVVPGAAMLARLEHRAVATMSEMQHKQLSQLLYAYAVLGMVPREGLMRGIDAQASFSMSSFDPRALCTTLWSFARLRVRPGESLLTGLEAQFLATVDSFEALEVSTVLWSYAGLGQRPGREVLAGLERRALATMHRLDLRGVADMLWACAVFGGGSTGHLVEDACIRALACLEAKSTDDIKLHLMQMHQFLLLMELSGGLGKNAQLLREAIGRDFSDAAEGKDSTQDVRLYDDVANTLKVLSLACETRVVDPDSGYRMDILIRSGQEGLQQGQVLQDTSNKGVVIEVDGPGRFVRGGGRSREVGRIPFSVSSLCLVGAFCVNVFAGGFLCECFCRQARPRPWKTC